MNVESIRKDFPILKRKINGHPLVYLDSAATTQKPKQVIQALTGFYEKHNSNVHRGVHTLSQEATELYDASRQKVADLINAKFEEVVFVRNATEAANIVLYSWAMKNLKKGDEIVSTVMEHHSNIVPWQSLQKQGVKLKFVDIDEEGKLKMEQFSELLTPRTKLVAVTQVSNVLGTINPAGEICKMAHDNGSLVFVDAAQSVPHMPVDVKNIDCDFLMFSGHKMLAPTGIGCLYGKADILESMEPFLLGSDMIKSVSLEEATFRESPWKFEPGTPNFGDAVALGAAVDYLQKIGMNNIREHEKGLAGHALNAMQDVKGIKIFGPKDTDIKGGVVSFNLGDIHSHDLATVLDNEGIAIRSGHHCAMPLMDRLGIAAASRASFYIYNTKKEIDMFINALEKARRIFKL
ncbi:MAG: cysteine desulfurase [Candidatus Aenigmarchaeota archaeon]|nr:cysteine desulfurase [Candidatus Aenigmarchaeota archaeon]